MGMLIPRRLTDQLRKLGTFFPAISLTGPRQAGKTTLLRELYPDYTYLSLENPTTRLAAQEDPVGFLRRHNDRVIFDEAQRFPELFSYLQGMIDEDRRPGTVSFFRAPKIFYAAEEHHPITGGPGGYC